jgi:hypothetical protein
VDYGIERNVSEQARQQDLVPHVSFDKTKPA